MTMTEFTDVKPSGFPGAFVWDIAATAKLIIPSIQHTVRRPLRPIDLTFTMAVIPLNWAPADIAIGQRQPVKSVYQIQIQTLVKDASEEKGITESSGLAKTIRRMLYEEPSLPISLASNEEDMFGNVERFQRLTVSGQRFMANEVKGHYLFFSVTDLAVETENA